MRNVGTGIAVLHGWQLLPELVFSREADGTHPPLEDFTTLTRDLYMAPGDVGFWQGSFRDPSSDGYREARRAGSRRGRASAVDMLYGDFEGGQRVISRFTLTPREIDGDVRWFEQLSVATGTSTGRIRATATRRRS